MRRATAVRVQFTSTRGKVLQQRPRALSLFDKRSYHLIIIILFSSNQVSIVRGSIWQSIEELVSVREGKQAT